MPKENPALPSIADILASEYLLSHPDSFIKVVKVGKFAVKYGHHVYETEAENLKFAYAAGLPVPKFHGFLVDPESKKSFIVMELIEGENLEKALRSLSEAEKEDAFRQIQEAVNHTRSLEPPGYIGSIGQKRLLDGIFLTDQVDATNSGPFTNQHEMNQGMLRRIAEECAPSHVELLRKVIEATLYDHRTVFTHADLQPKNIMVCRKDAQESDKKRTLEVKIIDWEMSGWYPEYWEFCNATVWGSSKPEWLGAVQKMMTVYPKEYLTVNLVRGIVFQL